MVSYLVRSPQVNCVVSVSYTHLDVYKRQIVNCISVIGMISAIRLLITAMYVDSV